MNDRAFVYGERWNIGCDWTRWLLGCDWHRTARYSNRVIFAPWIVTFYLGPLWLQVSGSDVPSGPATKEDNDA